MNNDLLISDEELRKDIEKKLRLYFRKDLILRDINTRIEKLKKRIEI